MATEDARYRESTQYRLWSFSPAQLAAIREQTNVTARRNIVSRLSNDFGSSSNTSTNNTPDPEPSQQASQSQQQDPATNTKPLEFLTPEEENIILTFHIAELLRMGDHEHMTAEVKATAVIFLRRFYTTCSLMTYPPTDMRLVALFFGSKAEGDFRNVTAFAHSFKENGDKILAGEFLLGQGIRWALDVKHPYRALEGAVMQLKRYGDLENCRIVTANARARDILKFSPLMTDAYFHYTPSQIMLASLFLADRELAERLIQDTFHPTANTAAAAKQNKSGDGKKGAKGFDPDKDKTDVLAPVVRDKVLEAIEACSEMLARELPERKEQYWTDPAVQKIIKPLFKKLKKCRDPDRTNLISLQRARREQAKGADSDDEDGSLAPKKDGSLVDDEDVFGGPVAGQRDVKRRKVSQAPPGNLFERDI